jgi:hypothetical protein
LDYDDLCSLILAIDPKIRSTSIYHNTGQLLAGGMRPGVASYLPREERTKSAISANMRWDARRLLFPFLGKGKYSLTEYEKVKRLSMPIDISTLLLVTMEVSANHTYIIDKIQELVAETV